MKLKLVIRIALVVSVVLLCAGFGVYSFFRLNAEEHRQEFNLYSLVPQNAVAVLETDRMGDLISDIDRMHCSRDHHFLYASELFVYLKEYLGTWSEATPHGLSAQMDKMLLSFHEPDTPLNQVLYCAMGMGDYDLVETFINKFSSSNFPSKYVDYHGEEIRIYPLADGHFLAVWLTREFFVASFQKKLVEQVVDARKQKSSLLQLASFRAMQAGKHHNVAATLYVRMKSVDLGRSEEIVPVQTQVGGWTEYDMKFSEEAIYCSGVSHDADTTQTFSNVLRHQQALDVLPGALLPASTFFYDSFSLSDKSSMWAFVSRQSGAMNDSLREEAQTPWLDFLEQHAGNEVQFCLFRPADTTAVHPHAVLSFPVIEAGNAERALQALSEGGRHQGTYRLPDSELFSRMTGVRVEGKSVYATVWQDRLWMAPDVESILACLSDLRKGHVLEEASSYEEGLGSLSPVYQFLMMADMEQTLRQPEAYARLLPSFFFRHTKFFRAFTVAIQFSCAEGVVYPNIVLFYKGAGKHT